MVNYLVNNLLGKLYSRTPVWNAIRQSTEFKEIMEMARNPNYFQNRSCSDLSSNISGSKKKKTTVTLRDDYPYLTAGGWHQHTSLINKPKIQAKPKEPQKRQLSDEEIELHILNMTNYLDVHYQNWKKK